MKSVELKNTKTIVSGNYTTNYINFTDGTSAKVVIKSKRTRAGLRYELTSITGNYNEDLFSISLDSENYISLEIIKLSKKEVELNEIVNHSVFGKCEILTTGEMMQIKVLKTKEEKNVMGKFFLNNLKN